MSKRGGPLVGLDVGTTKICAIVADVGEDGGLDIVGVGKHPSKGLNKGVVVNIEKTVESIKAAVEEAEFMSGADVHSAYVGIAGGHIRGFNSHGIVAIRNRVVSKNDTERVLEAAKAVNMPLDHEVIHVLPQEYVVDEQEGIRDPLGICGVRLEGKVHIVTGAVTSAQNIIRSVNRAGLDVEDLVLEPLASSLSALTDDERDLGVALVDIGGGTTDIAILTGGTIRYTSVITLGGNHITHDIAVGLRTAAHHAERIKKEHGCCLRDLVAEDEEVEVPSVGGRQPRSLSRRMLAEIIEPRVEEMLSLVKRQFQRSGLEEMVPAGAVLTGGSTILEGMPDLAERVLEMPVRRGLPMGVGGLVDMVSSPIYCTGVGLVHYGKEQGVRGRRYGLGGPNLFAKTYERMKAWFGEFFN